MGEDGEDDTAIDDKVEALAFTWAKGSRLRAKTFEPDEKNPDEKAGGMETTGSATKFISVQSLVTVSLETFDENIEDEVAVFLCKEDNTGFAPYSELSWRVAALPIAYNGYMCFSTDLCSKL